VRQDRVGSYIILGRLGAGAFSTVYRACHEVSGRAVALKVLDESKQDPTALDRFLREAKIAARLSDPAFPAIYEIGTDGDRHYIAMEIAEGRALTTVLLETGPVSFETVADLGSQLSRALTVAHGTGVIHRDIKPQNLVLAPDGRLRLLDFGLSRMLGAPSISSPGQLLGTVPYMSPEQVLGDDVDARSDIFSSSVVLYEIVAGRRPFEGDRFETVAHAILNLSPRRLPRADGGLGSLVERILFKGLSKSPPARYQSASEMFQDWEAVRTAGPSVSPRLPLLAQAVVVQAEHAGPRSAFVGRRAERERIQEVLDLARVGGVGNVVAVSGEAGVGKSRLVEEVCWRARAERFDVLAASCAGGRGTRPYQVWADVLDAYFRAQGWTTPAAVRDGLRAMGFELQLRVLDLLLRFSGEPLAQDTDERGLWESLSALLIRVARDRPLLIALDDLHRADDVSLQFLANFSHELGGSPIVVLGSLRVEEVGSERMGPLARTIAEIRKHDRLREVTLPPLAGSEVRELVGAKYGSFDRSATLAERVFRESGGNALYIVETLKLLEEREALRRQNGSWELTGELAELPIPPKVVDVIRERLDRVPGPLRELLDLAAVCGETFPADVISDGFELPPLRALRRLRTLEQDHGVLRSTERGYRFAQTKVREFLLEHLPPHLRAGYHLSVASTLERLHGADDERASEIAEHFLQGGDPARATAYLERAGDRDFCLFANGAALATYQAALDILEGHAAESDPRARCRLLRKICGVERRLGRYDEALLSASLLRKRAKDAGALDELGEAWMAIAEAELSQGNEASALQAARGARDAYTRAGDEIGMSRAIDQEGDVNLRMGKLDDALALYRDSLAVRERLDRDAERGQSHVRIGRCYRRMGRLDDSIRHLTISREILEAMGDELGVAKTTAEIGNTHFQRLRLREAADHFERALEVMRRAGERWKLAVVLQNAASVAQLMAELNRALALYRESLSMRIEIGDRHGTGIVQNNLGWLFLHRARFKEAILTAYDAVEIFQEVQDHRYLADASILSGRIYTALGDLAKAWRHFEVAQAMGGEVGDSASRVQAMIGKAGIRLVDGDAGAAEALVDAAGDAAGPGVSPDVRAELCMARARLAATAGRAEDARAAADEALGVASPLPAALLKVQITAGWADVVVVRCPDRTRTDEGPAVAARSRIDDALSRASAAGMRGEEYVLRRSRAVLLESQSARESAEEAKLAVLVADAVLSGLPDGYREGWMRVHRHSEILRLAGPPTD
jgi:tetratricopeptide (TPR) repeat protein